MNGASMVTIIVVAVIAYIVGAKYPGIARQFGIAA